MEDNLNARVGTFFNIVGLALMVMFIGSIMGKDIKVIYLLLSFVALVVAYLLRRNKPVNDSGRFGVIRRAGERRRQRREERMNQKQKKGNSPGKRRQMPQPGKESDNKNKREDYSDE